MFIIIIFLKSKKKDQEKINTAQKKIDDISRKLTDLETNEDFESAYKRFIESPIFNKIKSSFEGVTIMTKNVQDYSKLQLSNKDLVSVVKTFNSCFPKAIPTIKKDFASITPSDIKFIILGFMNLNNVEIAVLLGLTYGAANKRTNKIKNIFNIKEDLNQFLFTFIKSKF